MDVFEALNTRRSIARLEGDVDDAQLHALVDAALCAPNHKLTRPWRFTALRGAARTALGIAWAAILERSTSLEGAARDAFLARERSKPVRAPLVLVVSTRTDDDPVIAAEDFAATAAAVQNLLLAAQALGLGAIWRTGEMAYNPEINAHLGLEPADRIVAFVYIGRPAMESPRGLPRDVAAVLRILE
jgi:nitroreductase